MLHSGIYEQLINKEIQEELSSLEKQREDVTSLEVAELSKILAKYLSSVVEKGLESLKNDVDTATEQIKLVNRLIQEVKRSTDDDFFDTLEVEEPGKQLLSLVDIENSDFVMNHSASLPRPTTSIAQSSLFTGAIHEPQMFSELKKEIISASSIDMLVSFIKWSGLRLIYDELTDFTKKGGRIRIITTSYMGATDVKAVEKLYQLPNTTIKISYDTKRTRLHAKTYVFYRNTGFSTAYVGSSNLSNAAISSGLEWNTKVTQQDLPEVMGKINGTFESYWNAREFELFTLEDKERLVLALSAERQQGGNDLEIYTFDITPYGYQQEILDKLQAEREVRGFYRNLVVAATGTGKTVISAFDYRRFSLENPKSLCRLLFVAHREEILLQSVHTFRGVLKNPNFGDLYVGNHRPQSIDHLFVSVQTFNSQKFTEKTSLDYYDFIVVDEFHHAAAPTYQELLSHYQPKIFLGLTATPERMDGEDILSYFNYRIAAEIRLPEAIDRKLLAPFQYFGVSDTVNLNELKWSRGGYDKRELSNIYTMTGLVATKRADLVLHSLNKYLTNWEDTKGLGFCVSVAHAEFMAEHFQKAGIPSISLLGKSTDEERFTAKRRLIEGGIRFIFVVDLYNEGVDIPAINTVLFLRPTESLTVFIQQLGRGLRLSEGKECLTVLDFIGQAHQKYNFEEKWNSLLCQSRHSVKEEIEQGFLSVPKGCYIHLEKKAKEYILHNIRGALSAKNGIISRISTFSEDTGLPLTLINFLNYYNMDPKTLYKRGSFSRLSVQAGVRDDFNEELEPIMTKAFLRFASTDSRRLISFIKTVLTEDKTQFSPEEQGMLKMLHFSLWQKSPQECGHDSYLIVVEKIKSSPILQEELLELLVYQQNSIAFIDKTVDLGFPCPLDVHCTYTRDQILVAMDFEKPASVREGVKYLPEKKVDIFFVTLNKSEKEYSPTTMYHDYSINDVLFHWQSQSNTADTSVTGLRYREHKKNGSRILLFVREYKTDPISGLASPYVFLGTANYVTHTGSRPMSITWKLDEPLPARLTKKTNKLVVN